MSDSVKNSGSLRAGVALAISVALAGAAWSVLKREGCDACNSAALLVGDLNLGLAGLIFYGVLLALAFWMLRKPVPASGPSIPRGLALPILFAGGVHLTLVALLAKNHLFCPSCFTTAAGAFVAVALVITSRAVRFRWSVLVVALMAVGTFAGLKVLKGNANQVAMRQAYLARQTLLREAPPAHGVARLVVFVHPTCHVCKRFKEQVLAPLRKEYNTSELLIEERPAWKGMATPTSVVLGEHPALLVGFKDLPAVRKAVQEAHGGSAKRPTTLTMRSR